MNITLAQAHTIIAAALAHGHEHGLKPLSVAVLDAGGISGDTSDNDGAAAIAGISAAGLSPAAA